jgi:hypothetical protein
MLRSGDSEQDRRNTYRQSMLRDVGCNADTHLLSAASGDEITLRRDLVGLDMGDRAELGKAFVQAFKRHDFDLAPAAAESGLVGSIMAAARKAAAASQPPDHANLRSDGAVGRH